MSSSRSDSGYLSLLFGIAAIGGVVWWLKRPKVVEAPPAMQWSMVFAVTTAPVETGDVAETIELVGDVQAPERSRLAFERAGRIRELPIRVGDVVRAGAVLARLDDTVMEEQVKASAASLAQAKEMADLAARDAERIRRMKDVDVSEAALDRVDAVARNEAAKVAQMEADLALQRARLAQGTLLAPYDAVVTERPVALGSYVAAGDACCELLSLERRDVLLELPSGVAGSVRVGASVTLRSDALSGFELVKPLVTVLPPEDVRSRSFAGVVRLDGADDPERRLRPGMFVRAKIELRAARGALVVPIDALRLDDGHTLVVTASAGEKPTAAFVPVTVLARDDRRAAVAPIGGASLVAGDRIVVAGKENVFPGAALNPVAPPVAPPAEHAESGSR